MIPLTPDEVAWLAVYRGSPEIRAAVRAEMTGSISLNMSQGLVLTADLRLHLTLKKELTEAPAMR